MRVSESGYLCFKNYSNLNGGIHITGQQGRTECTCHRVRIQQDGRQRLLNRESQPEQQVC